IHYTEALRTGNRLGAHAITSGICHPYEFPVKKPFEKAYAEVKCLVKMAKASHKVLKKVYKERRGNTRKRAGDGIGLQPLPELFKFKNEDNQWKQYCENVSTSTRGKRGRKSKKEQESNKKQKR
ncbi:MAG: hypothetical protein SGILL_010519, partial [Bacillariaceae sp.]